MVQKCCSLWFLREKRPNAACRRRSCTGCSVCVRGSSTFWVLVDKSEPALNAALTQVQQMRDKVIPKLQATNSHQQRLCLEMKHKVLSAEMKLRASLERQESRGAHYRSDFPYRDDDNFLCYITITKGDNGDMVINRVPLKPEWVGDTSADYATRYAVRFPGEAKAKGLPEEEKSGGWSGK